MFTILQGSNILVLLFKTNDWESQWVIGKYDIYVQAVFFFLTAVFFIAYNNYTMQ
jgi:hypothetical protein